MRPSTTARAVAAGSLVAGGGPLLARMAREQRGDGFSRPTAVGVWAAWGAWTALLVDAATSGARGRTPSGAPLAVGGLGALAGAGVLAAGGGAFPSSAQLTGTETTELVTGGVYRFSRNPQYLGAVLVGGGVATATRSVRAAGLTAVLAVVLDRWTRVEEDALAGRFGEAWAHYRNATPRWIGPPTTSRP